MISRLTAAVCWFRCVTPGFVHVFEQRLLQRGALFGADVERFRRAALNADGTEESETSVVKEVIGFLRFVSDQPSQVMTLSMMATPKKISHRVISAFSLASRPFSSSMVSSMVLSLVGTGYSGMRVTLRMRSDRCR